MMSTLLALAIVGFPISWQQDLSPEVRQRFSIGQATPILQRDSLPPHAGFVAERMNPRARSGAPAFVSEDGKAVAIWVGAVDKFDVESRALLTERDKYRVNFRGDRMVAFNVSQEIYIEGRALGGRHMRPLVLIDKYRTLCAIGAASVADSNSISENDLILAVIDDRQRGTSPNRVRRVRLPYGVGIVAVVAERGDWYTLRPSPLAPQRFLEVNVNTLETRSVRSVDLSDWAWAPELISRLQNDEGVVVRSAVRWNGRSYYLADARRPDETSDYSRAYVWDGAKFEHIGPWAIVAASPNGRHGWLLNRMTGASWMISK